MNSVYVKFVNSEYNYSTSIAKNVNQKQAMDYFIGKYFNLGIEGDNLQLCIDIDFKGAKND